MMLVFTFTFSSTINFPFTDCVDIYHRSILFHVLVDISTNSTGLALKFKLFQRLLSNYNLVTTFQYSMTVLRLSHPKILGNK